MLFPYSPACLPTRTSYTTQFTTKLLSGKGLSPTDANEIPLVMYVATRYSYKMWEPKLEVIHLIKKEQDKFYSKKILNA